ncbi:MAG: cupin domain-containing protein [Deltaproteobacteria bacterium]|nr:cupin domain-containing protein [Deltaproteobacteria bacterium]
MTKKTAKPASFGKKIRSLREERGLTVEDLSHETGYPADMLDKVETDKVVPPVSLVIQLSRIFKIDMDQLESEEEKKASQRRIRSHKKRVDSYAYTPLSRPGGDKHLRAYLVTIDPETKHKGVEFHHEGEEFIYVLQGGITIQVGENVSKLGPGKSIHFNSALHHKLSNHTKETAELLVIVYVP